jgi:hypothetical protein
MERERLDREHELAMQWHHLEFQHLMQTTGHQANVVGIELGTLAELSGSAHESPLEFTDDSVIPWADFMPSGSTSSS